MGARIVVALDKIRANAASLVERCALRGIKVVAVTKGTAGCPLVAKALMMGGVSGLADSRLLNIKRLRSAGVKAPLMLLRSPALKEVKEVVRWADISLNTEVEVLRALAGAARELGKLHQVILMVELGDGREGLMPREVLQVARVVKGLDGLKLSGIGANFTCLSGEPPTRGQLEALVEIGRRIEEENGTKLNIISGGNSSTLPLIFNGEVPAGINQVRLGESILLGHYVPSGKPVPGLYQDAFTLLGEVIEVKTKPFKRRIAGGMRVNRIEGIRDGDVSSTPGFRERRAILNLGWLDFHSSEGISPRIKGVEVVGASSDHLVLDITEAEGVSVGEEIPLSVDYHALATLMASRYVERSFAPMSGRDALVAGDEDYDIMPHKD